jgi:hypothetical protein
MLPILETIALTALASLGFLLGLRFGWIKKRCWLLGYALPLSLVVLVSIGRNYDQLRLVFPFSLALAARNEYVILAFAVPMVLGTLIPRIPLKRTKILLSVLLVMATINGVALPFLVPALIRSRLARLETWIAPGGVCLQNTHYTCGPAAAVTALLKFGIKAEEGELAVLAHTTPFTGTPDDLLADAIEQRYARDGIRCEYRRFDSIEQLKETCPTIAVVRFAFLVDHYITVLEVHDDKIVVGDPTYGRKELTHDEFRDKWRSIGIVVSRQ